MIALNTIQSQHKSTDNFEDLVETLVKEFDGTADASGLKAWVCGPQVAASPTMYHYVGPNQECRRWVQPVNMKAGEQNLSIHIFVAFQTVQCRAVF